jgi:5-methylcytosine-specific restriction endonuclease McrA
MARSYYYNNQKLNQYIQPRIKKYYNYTHQKLVEEEISIKRRIEDESKIIKKIELDINKGRDIENKYTNQQRVLESEIKKEEREQRSKIEKNSDIIYPLEPSQNNIINGRNIICFILSGFAAFSFSQDIADGIGFILFMPAFFFLFKVIAYWILKADDENETQKYLKAISAYNRSIESKFQPSQSYKKNKEQLININQTLSNIKNHFDRDYKTIRSSKFEIVLLKKILFEFKRFKKRASERERTAKINAFEKKNRSGAQNIKDKLLKAVRVKSKWTCPYCNNSSDVNVAEADHIHPVNKGGLTTSQNMVLICKKCNSKKTNLMLRVFCKKQGYNYNDICDRLEKLGKDV